MRDWGFGEFKSLIAMVRKEQVHLLLVTLTYYGCIGTLDT